jgi:hypothetical protein
MLIAAAQTDSALYPSQGPRGRQLPCGERVTAGRLTDTLRGYGMVHMSCWR